MRRQNATTKAMKSSSPSQSNLINYSSWELLQDIWKELKPYRARFFLATMIRAAGDLAWLYPAFAFASIITFLTHYKQGDSLGPILVIIWLWLLATIARSLSQFFSKSLGYSVSERVKVSSIRHTIQHLFLLDMAWHERENSGNKIKRIQNAGDGFNQIIRLWFNNIIEITVNLVAINIILARFDYKILGLILGFLISYFLLSALMRKQYKEAAYRVNIQEEEINGLLFEAINNIRTVKVMAMAKGLYAQVVKGTEVLLEKLGVRIFWYQSRGALLSFWAGMFKIVITIWIIFGIIKGHYELGFLMLFNSYFTNLRMSIDELSTASIDFASSRLSIARMKMILNEPIQIDNDKDKGPFPSNWESIKVQNLSFSYENNQVLHNLSFEVKRGEKVGIVGLSGAGKSTLFKLLLKERESFEGDILFDDLSITRIKKTDYFNHVSVVLQDTEVFNFSLKDNITITSIQEKDNEDLLTQALATAHITELVHKLPQGLDTLIGEKGVKLSGGERQRLGIARAIFKQPDILFLDEATSHLDLESEEKIRDSLHLFFENVTAIVIAHRLTTLKEMDKILVLEGGQIIESGSFYTLYAKQGRFFELWEKQKLG